MPKWQSHLLPKPILDRNLFRMSQNVFQTKYFVIEFLVQTPDSINGDGSDAAAAAATGGSRAHLMSTPQRVKVHEVVMPLNFGNKILRTMVK